mmetsp:Transcript_30114/g.29383  ORF Transcript_30114/g.29383 Transcript_30114/m.29383 type:complete len:97 (+) Transcript_30114:2967-3257(+)
MVDLFEFLLMDIQLYHRGTLSYLFQLLEDFLLSILSSTLLGLLFQQVVLINELLHLLHLSLLYLELLLLHLRELLSKVCYCCLCSAQFPFKISVGL